MTIGQAAYAYPEQDHISHIVTHLEYAADPVFGGNPMVAPTFLPKAIEHIKQHLALWYLDRMKGYVRRSLGRKPDDYAEAQNPQELDKLYGAAAQHVKMDSEQTLAKVMPIIQQMVQGLEQFKPKPDMTPDGQVLLQTSMAETQRRAARDQAEMQMKAQDMAAKLQLAQQKQLDDKDLAIEELRLKLAIAEGDQETKERIETARLTRDAARLRHDQDKTVMDFTVKGAPRGYQ
jgi:hypothetical protein